MPTPVTPTPAGVTVAEFNAATASDLVDQLAELFSSRTLATAVADARPFADVDQICETASQLLADLDRKDGVGSGAVLESVNDHPPIGGTVAAGSRSAAEQSAAARSEGENGELEAVRNLQPTYREKFGWNFLIRAAGLDSRQILDALVERLAHEPEDEWPVVVRNLDAINQLRLRGYVSDNTEETPA